MKKAFSLTALLALRGLGVGVLASCQDIPVVYLGQEASHEHSWNEGVVTKEATCTEEDEMTYTYECGETRTEPIPATGHTWGEWSADVVSGEDQGTHTRVCTVCQTPETEAHQWGSWTSVTDSEGSHYERVYSVCETVAVATGVEDIVKDLGEDETFSIEVDNADDLSSALVDGATVVIPAAEEGETPVIELSSALEVSEGVSTTLVVGDGATLTLGFSATANTEDGSYVLSMANSS